MAAFARALDESQSIVGRWANGKITRPTADARRKLARELGVRHVDILVMAGELWPSEVRDVATPVAAPRSEVEALFESLTPARQRMVLQMLRDVARGQEQRQAVNQAVPPLLPSGAERD